MRRLPARRTVSAGVGVMTVMLLAGCGQQRQQALAPAPPVASNPPAPATPSPSEQAPGGASVGRAAPDFATETTQGKPISLRSLRGKVVLLDYWATWCVPCKMAMPTLESLHRRYVGQGLKVVGISVDDSDSVRAVPAVARALGVTYTLSASPDDNNRAQKAYGVQGIPSQFLIDKKGVIRWAQGGFSFSEKQELSALIQKLLAEPA
ncbi:MAG: TlpA family protein disulfide reductase [Armatimonadetes bacterium]|nr:TlpA family protein disulfide reductase [Armatimonadota bacterium]